MEAAQRKKPKDRSEHTPADLQSAVGAAFAEGHVFLRREGRSPLSFKGRLLGLASSHSSGTRLWYEVSLYERNGHSHVVAVKVYKKPTGDRDIFRAESFQRLEDAIAYIEAYDPAEDVGVNIDMADKTTSIAELTLRAVVLRQKIEEARSEYRAAAGELIARVLMD
jgi:hypothetical protein